ncbi:NAD(P)-binding domain-containing protein [Arthrobacter sp. B6]|uniref:NAD(P)-binding domain-containing protein n=1 Tax=Arthrobacter sp. B6 TaxID=1570137 RepID=UPI0012E7550B
MVAIACSVSSGNERRYSRRWRNTLVATERHASLFIGLGNMGRPMAMNYSAGRELFVYDTNARSPLK